MAEKLKPHEACKLAGLKSLNELAFESKEPVSNLINWFHDRPHRFRLVLQAAVIARLLRNMALIQDAMPIDEEAYTPDRKSDAHAKRKQA